MGYYERKSTSASSRTITPRTTTREHIHTQYVRKSAIVGFGALVIGALGMGKLMLNPTHPSLLALGFATGLLVFGVIAWLGLTEMFKEE